MKRYRYIQKTLLLTMLLVLSAGVLGNNNQDLVIYEIDTPYEVLSDEVFIARYHVLLCDFSENMEMPKIDKFRDFDVVSEPQTKSEIINNIDLEPTDLYLIITYKLKAKKSGVCHLPQIKTKIGKKTYTSKKIKINVINNNIPLKKKLILKDEDAFIRTFISRKHISLSDTLTVIYRLYSLAPIRGVSGVMSINLPRNDFYLEQETGYGQPNKKEVYEGKEYFTKDIRILFLRPKSEGQKTINGGDIEFSYQVNTGRKVRNQYGIIVDEVIYLNKKMKIDDISIAVTKLFSI